MALENGPNKPEPLQVDWDRSCLFTKQRCGNCIHLRRIAHPAYQKVCVNHGITEIHQPCEKFSPDPTKLKFKNERHIRNVLDALEELSPEKLRLLSTLIDQEPRTRRYGFSVRQTVYIKVFGGDYISNYRRAKVMYADRKYVHIIGDDGFTAMTYHKSVLTPKQWIRKKRQLENDEKITDPNYYKYVGSTEKAKKQVRQIKDNHKVLEFDSTQRHDFAITRDEKLPRKRSGMTPLTELIRIRGDTK